MTISSMANYRALSLQDLNILYLVKGVCQPSFVCWQALQGLESYRMSEALCCLNKVLAEFSLKHSRAAPRHAIERENGRGSSLH